MNLRCINSIDDFQELKSDWDRLSSEPLRSFAWHFAWWSHFQHLGELSLFVYEDDGAVVGIAPFFVDRWNGQRRLRFIGSGSACTDYARLVVSPPWQADFSKAIADHVSQADSAVMLEFEGLDDSGAMDSIDQPLQGRFWRYETEMDAAWQLELPGQWKDFIAGSKKSLKRKIKKAEKHLASEDFQIKSTLEDLELSEAWGLLTDFHQRRFIGKGAKGAFADPHMEAFLHQSVQDLAAKEQAEIIVAFHQGQAFGAHLLLHEEDKTLLYLAGMLPEKTKFEPGHLMITFATRRAIEQGRSMFDFLRGNQPYKSYWGAQPSRLQSVRFVSRSVVPTIINRGFLMLRSLKHRAAYLKGFSKQAST